MKKTVVLLAAAAAAMLSCTREELSVEESRTVLTIGVQTKTTLGERVGDERQIYWATGDQVCVSGVTSSALSDITPDTVTKTDFAFPSAPSTPYRAVYPASLWMDAGAVTLPVEASRNVFPLAGKSSMSPFGLNTITSGIRVTLKQKASDPDTDSIKLIEVSTENTRLSGHFFINWDTATLTPAGSPEGDDLKVRLTGNWDISTQQDFFIPVPAGTYNFEVKVVDEKNHYMIQKTTSAKTLTKGSALLLKAFEFDPANKGGELIVIKSAQDLIDFAGSYEGESDIIVQLANDIAFDADASTSFSATGGIGAGEHPFSGTFDGDGHSITGLTATCPVFAQVGQDGAVKNLTLGSGCSVTHSAAVSSSPLYLGAIVGCNQGDLTNCKNYASVSCTSSSFSAALHIGGLVGTQYKSGSITGCINYATVGCSASGPSSVPVKDGGVDNYTTAIYMGGVVGSIQRLAKGDDAAISDTRNEGAVNGGFADDVISHVAGVVGWINGANASADKLEISGLSNTANVTLVNRSKNNNYAPALVAGLIGGIHGVQVSSASLAVDVTNSYVSSCTVSNGGWSNAGGYGETCHTGGFIGVARGGTITFDRTCYVSDVDVLCRRGFAGGFAACVQGTTLNGCKVLNASVQGTLARLVTGGGLVGQVRSSSSVQDCIVTLTKSSEHSLYGNNASDGTINLGGIAGEAAASCTIDACKAYVDLMYAGTWQTLNRGWIVGDGSNFTVKNCYLGGTYGSSEAELTLTSDNFSDYISGGTAPSLLGDQHYWDGSDAPSATTTVEIDIHDYAVGKGWARANHYTVVESGCVTLTESHTGDNNGMYYTDSPADDWRFYYARGGGLTVSVPASHSLVSATFTYRSNNQGVLVAPDGITNVSSGTKCLLSGNTASFTLSRTGGTGSAQVQITNIVIEYE